MSELRAKVEKRVKDREKMAADIQAHIENLAKGFHALLKHDIETYKLLTNPDTLLNDSPISQFWNIRFIKDNMIKLDMDFIGSALDGKGSLKNFSEMAKEQSKWVLRFTKEPEKKKTGIDSIL